MVVELTYFRGDVVKLARNASMDKKVILTNYGNKETRNKNKLSKTLKIFFPLNDDLCKIAYNKNLVKVGDIILYQDRSNTDFYIANLTTKNPNQFPYNFEEEAFEECARKLDNLIIKHGIEMVFIPKISYDWDKIKHIIDKVTYKSSGDYKIIVTSA